MTKDEALKMAQDLCPYFDEISKGAFYEGFITALDQLPDATKMIDTGTDRGAWSDVPDATKWVDEINQALEQDDHGFDRTASHMAGEYVDTAQQEPFALKVYQGEICYMSQDDDQSFGMWCPVNCDTDHGFPNETIFYIAQQAPAARVNNDGFIVETGFGLLEGTLLYTSPPKREWVGLTDKEMESIWNITQPEYQDRFAFARAVEAKLKEKNTCR